MHFIPIQMYFKVELSFQHLNFSFNFLSLWFLVFEWPNDIFAPIMNTSITGNSMNVID